MGAGMAQMQALIDYANEKTGMGDTSMGNAVLHLAEGYGQGGDTDYEWERDSSAPDLDAFAEELENELASGSEFFIMSFDLRTADADNLVAFNVYGTGSDIITANIYKYVGDVRTLVETRTVTALNSSYYNSTNTFVQQFTGDDWSDAEWGEVVVSRPSAITVLRIVSPTLASLDYNTGIYSMPCYEFVSKASFSSAILLQNSTFERVRCISLAANDVSSSFRSMSNLRYCDLGGCSTITRVYYTFDGDYNLRRIKGITLTSSCTSANNGFSLCRSLEKIDGNADWDLSGCTSLSAMFQNCIHLKGLDTEKWNPLKSTSLGSLFSNCYSLESVSLKGWEMENKCDMNCMFQNCFSLKIIDMSGFVISTTTGSQNYVFQADYNLQNIIVDDSTSITINSTSATAWFEWCCSLEDSSIVSKITVAAATVSMGSFFSACIRLRGTLAAPAAKYTAMSSMFNNCGVDTIDLSNADLSGIPSASYAYIAYSNILFHNIIFPSDSSKMFNVSVTFNNAALSHEALVNLINALPTTSSSLKLTLGTTNLAKLTDDEKAIATDKGWTLA